MSKTNLFSFLYSFVFAISSCNTSYQAQAVKYREYKVSNAGKGDEKLNALVKPYADSVNKSMKDVIAVAVIPLEKKQPEGTLGNLMADIMLTTARQQYKTNVDAAVINYGGIRLPFIAAGDITRGTVFELSPFDNIVVILRLTGKELQSFLDHIASRGGWPVAGLTMQIKNKKAGAVKINNEPIDANTTYTLAVLDYVANGGDDAVMLRTIPQVNNGYLYRDGILAYLSAHKKIDIKISENEPRISNAE